MKGGGDLGCMERARHGRQRYQPRASEYSPGSRGLECTLSVRLLSEGGWGVTKKDICFINDDPFNILKSHLGFGAPSRRLIAGPGQLVRELFVRFVLDAVPPPTLFHLQQLVRSAHEDVDRARYSEVRHAK